MSSLSQSDARRRDAMTSLVRASPTNVLRQRWENSWMKPLLTVKSLNRILVKERASNIHTIAHQRDILDSRPIRSAKTGDQLEASRFASRWLAQLLFVNRVNLRAVKLIPIDSRCDRDEPSIDSDSQNLDSHPQMSFRRANLYRISELSGRNNLHWPVKYNLCQW